MADVVARMDLEHAHRALMPRLALSMVVALGLVGCTPTSGGTPTPTPAPSQAPSTSASSPTDVPSQTPVPPSPGPQTNPVDRDSLANGGSFSIGVTAFPASWNPWSQSPFSLDPALDAMTARFFATAADGALHWDSSWLLRAPVVTTGTRPDGTGGTVWTGAPAARTPGQPDSTVPTASTASTASTGQDESTDAADGDMTVAYSLNPRAVWSDGAPITVDDFSATWQACLTAPGPACADRGFDHVVDIREGADPSQILVVYDGDYSAWPYTFARGPFRADLVSTDANRAEAWDSPAERAGAFSGPFTVSSMEDGVVTLVRNPLWWGAYPKLDSISESVVDPSSVVLGYLRGDLDGFWVQDVNLYSRASGITALGARRSLGADQRFIVMNGSAGPLADPVVRSAVMASLDREKLASSDLAGWKGVAPVLNSPIWALGQPEYHDLMAGAKPVVDVKSARASLDAAGWVEGGDGIRSKDGVDLAWDFLVPQGDSLTENEAFGVRAQLRLLGVEVSLVYVDPGDVPAMMASGQYQMTASTLRYRTPVASGERFATGNLWMYSDAGVDALARQAVRTLDPAQRAVTLNSLASIVWRDAPVIPLYEVPEVFMARDGLANYGPAELGTILWESVGWVS